MVGEPQACDEFVLRTLRRSVLERGSSTAHRRAMG